MKNLGLKRYSTAFGGFSGSSYNVTNTEKEREYNVTNIEKEREYNVTNTEKKRRQCQQY